MTKADARQLNTRPVRTSLALQFCLLTGMVLSAAVASAADGTWTSESAALQAESGAAAGASTPSASILEISSSSLPRFDNFDGGNRTQQRIDIALLSPGRSAFGVTLGMTSLAVSRYGFTGAGPEGPSGVSLGLQWRYLIDSGRRLDITAWRELGRPGDALALVQSRDAGYGARVEMQLSGSRRTLVADRGFLGVQLDSGARIALKRSAGKPMVYYRNSF